MEPWTVDEARRSTPELVRISFDFLQMVFTSRGVNHGPWIVSIENVKTTLKYLEFTSRPYGP